MTSLQTFPEQDDGKLVQKKTIGKSTKEYREYRRNSIRNSPVNTANIKRRVLCSIIYIYSLIY